MTRKEYKAIIQAIQKVEKRAEQIDAEENWYRVQISHHSIVSSVKDELDKSLRPMVKGRFNLFIDTQPGVKL